MSENDTINGKVYKKDSRPDVAMSLNLLRGRNNMKFRYIQQNVMHVSS